MPNFSLGNKDLRRLSMERPFCCKIKIGVDKDLEKLTIKRLAHLRILMEMMSDVHKTNFVGMTSHVHIYCN